MLISTDKRFILLSPTKVASSSVGALLSPLCDIRIGDPAFGKHDQLSEVVERYYWIFDRIPLNEFKIFLLFRDPLERALSLYKSHAGAAFRDSETSTFGMPMRQFVSSWLAENTWMSLPQFLHGLNRDRGFLVDFVIRAENLPADLSSALATVDAAVDLTWLARLNESPAISDEGSTRADLRKALGKLYAVDQYILDRFAGRRLSETEKLELSSHISACCGGKANRDDIQRLVFERFKARSRRLRASGRLMNQERVSVP